MANHLSSSSPSSSSPGSSLSQARGSSSHSHHNHLFAHAHNQHHHLRHSHGHHHSPQGSPDPQPDQPSPVDIVDDLLRRVENLVTHVVQTISIVQVNDPAGNPIETHTVHAPPATVVVDANSGNTVAISPPPQSVVPVPAPVPNPAATDAAPASSTADDATAIPDDPGQPPQSLSPPPPPPPPDAPLYPTSSSQATVPTSAPLNPSGVPGAHNATNTHHGGNMTIAGNPKSKTVHPLDFSSKHTHSAPSAENTRFLSHAHSTISHTVYSTTSSYQPTSTDDVSGAGFGGSGSDDSQSDSDSGASDGDDGGLSTHEKRIVGGVVGGVAAAAFFLLLVMLAIRYKRRKDGRTAIGGDNLGAAGSRAITADSGGEMSERSSPFGVAAAMASLTGNRNSRSANSPTSERGFQRVSGRKLPSVLSHGGDGYTDPRESTLSGTSDYHRGSQAFDRSAGGSSKVALGSPMRPVSGVPVFRPGPARTPLTAQNPFADPPSPPPRPPLGRSMPSQDGSGHSVSRFQEDI